MNAINVITPYVENGIWKFDDEKRSLKSEPFVGTTNDIISTLIDESIFIDKTKEVSIFFAEEDFPGAEYVLTADGEDGNGMWYRWGDHRKPLRGWLCPATLKFFESFPKRIFIMLYTNPLI